MEKKVSSKPMKAILEHLTRKGDIEAVIFPERMILEDPIESWPVVEVIISFFSTGFPLEKAVRYVKLRNVQQINDLASQIALQDRRMVYGVLDSVNIPHPQSVVVERDPVTNELLGEAAKNFEEGDDYIVVGDVKLAKPFVEKPTDAEDHNICIYYPSSAGGGVKNLFRKVKDRSSAFDPEGGRVRTDKSYIYEPFMKTGGTDIKVYTVGEKYAHAEARKSPVIDGIVNRNEDGKEVRFPVVLTPKEKDWASAICKHFCQFVCGFDLLRTADGSFVIDVNGWSFVKGLPKYYEDAAWLLRENIMIKCRAGNPPMLRVDSLLRCPDAADTEERAEMEDKPVRSDRWEHEELLAVIGIMRHGDRTPKNKMKLTTQLAQFLDLHKAYAKGTRKEVKLKAPRQLQEVLDITYALIGHNDVPPEGNRSRAPSPPPACSRGAANAPLAAAVAASFASTHSDPEQIVAGLDERTLEAVRLIQTVLETGGSFDGIYRKVQLKPTAWKSGEDGAEEVTEVQVILKYGGILTQVGVKQAERLGHRFRGEMYPGEEAEDRQGNSTTGLLRLHATQRHDFKVYSSDEGRVQMSAASFSRGLLDLEGGSLTPVCVALVENDSLMLDDLPAAAAPLLEEAKSRLYNSITGDKEREKEKEKDKEKSHPGTPSGEGGGQLPPPSPAGAGCGGTMLPQAASSTQLQPDKAERLVSFDMLAAVKVPEDAEYDKVEPMLDGFKEVQDLVDAVNKELEEELIVDGQSKGPKPLLVRKRWQKLKEDMWDKKKKNWDVSKFPEIHDAVKYDLIHNPTLAKSFLPLHEVSKRINDVIVPHEYGWDARSRLRIGSVVCGRLLKKVMIDLSNTLEAMSPSVETAKIQQENSVPYLMRSDSADWGGLGGLFSHLKKQMMKVKGWGGAEEKPPDLGTVREGEELAVDGRDVEVRQDPEPDAEAEGHDAAFKEAEFAGLDIKKAGDLRSPHRRVRTRLYFTSESHIQTLMNVLRQCHLFPTKGAGKACDGFNRQGSPGAPSDSEDGDNASFVSATELNERRALVCPEMEKWLREKPMFDYLTQIVFRLYEDKRVAVDSPGRFRVEVLFSPGAATDGPPKTADQDEALDLHPLRPLHSPDEPLTYARLQELLAPFTPKPSAAPS